MVSLLMLASVRELAWLDVCGRVVYRVARASKRRSPLPRRDLQSSSASVKRVVKNSPGASALGERHLDPSQ